jgi:hypothetical protein
VVSGVDVSGAEAACSGRGRGLGCGRESGF